MKNTKRQRGFSLVEVLVGLFLVGVAVIGLAQLFLVAVTNNLRADRVANATFLAQQQIDWLRGFTLDELIAYTGTTLDSRDEIIDLNLDGTNDFRRITNFPLLAAGSDVFEVQVHVYSAENINAGSASELLSNVQKYRPRALFTTIITR